MYTKKIAFESNFEAGLVPTTIAGDDSSSRGFSKQQAALILSKQSVSSASHFLYLYLYLHLTTHNLGRWQRQAWFDNIHKQTNVHFAITGDSL